MWNDSWNVIKAIVCSILMCCSAFIVLLGVFGFIIVMKSEEPSELNFVITMISVLGIIEGIKCTIFFFKKFIKIGA